MKLDIFLVGVGGQGILTIGELISEAAHRQSIPVNFFPSKGMAQRGGFVKAQLRLGRELVGPIIPERGADIVVAMELSESLKALRYIKANGDFVLFGECWEPTAVMLGKAPYPKVEEVKEQVIKSGARLIYLDPDLLPKYENHLVASNIYILGALIQHTKLKQIITADLMEEVMQSRWKRGVEANKVALHAGIQVEPETHQIASTGVTA